MLADAPHDILHFLIERNNEGLDTILVTLTKIIGSSPRALGAQMAICADGRHAGSFSGGCIEAAIVTEAIATLDNHAPRMVRYGIGSPYIDIRLPCSGGIDLHFLPRPDLSIVEQLLARLGRRELAALRLSGEGLQIADAAAVTTSGWRGQDFEIRYRPPPRLLIIGQGDEVSALARLASFYGCEVAVCSPDEDLLRTVEGGNIAANHLATLRSLPTIVPDRWTAVALLFHDREWEAQLLPWALAHAGFYCGALGSRHTHEARLAALDLAGVPDHQRQILRAPIGLIPATRDPATLALSILAEIVREYHDSDPASSELVQVGLNEGNGRLSEATF